MDSVKKIVNDNHKLHPRETTFKLHFNISLINEALRKLLFYRKIYYSSITDFKNNILSKGNINILTKCSRCFSKSNSLRKMKF